jgi:hypothetical protein
MLPQKVLINVSVDAFAGANENDWTLLAVTAIIPRTICFSGALDLGEMPKSGSTSAKGKSVRWKLL